MRSLYPRQTRQDISLQEIRSQNEDLRACPSVKYPNTVQYVLKYTACPNPIAIDSS